MASDEFQATNKKEGKRISIEFTQRKTRNTQQNESTLLFRIKAIRIFQNPRNKNKRNAQLIQMESENGTLWRKLSEKR